MDWLTFDEVKEPGWEPIFARAMRPSLPQVAHVLERTFGLTASDARRAAAVAEKPREEIPYTRDAEELRRRGEHMARHQALVKALAERALPPAEAWRTLAPNDWRSTDRRLFAGPQYPRGSPPDGPALRASWTAWTLVRDAPTHDAMYTLLGDPPGVVRVEGLAREACRQLGLKADTILWWVEPNARLVLWLDQPPFRADADARLGLTRETLARGERIVEGKDPPLDDVRKDWLKLAKRDLVRRNAWRTSASENAFVNPFEPIVKIWRAGYAFVGVQDERLILATSSRTLAELVAPIA